MSKLSKIVNEQKVETKDACSTGAAGATAPSPRPTGAVGARSVA